jgi:hypothetical protein
MIIVPVAGDRILTSKGLPSKVLSYTNYKPEGPAVLVEGLEGGATDTVFFKDIVEINDQKVKLIKNADGYNVFELDGFFKRKFQLPRPGESISSDVSGVETRQYEVKRLNLHVKNQLSRGMIIYCTEKDTNEVIEITLSQITDIAHYLFSRTKFLAYYADYSEKGTT